MNLEWIISLRSKNKGILYSKRDYLLKIKNKTYSYLILEIFLFLLKCE